MHKVNVELGGGKTREYYLEDYAVTLLNGADYDDGDWEALNRTATNNSRAIGCLLDTLLSQGVIDVDVIRDVLMHPTLELKEVE